jgi:signal transduction histidine kinase
VWASRQADPSARVILAVFRDLAPDEQDGHRTDILGAFVAHAATVVANAGLHEDVQRALEHQVVLNRQKSEFVAAVSHELRTPLAGVIGSVQTIHRCGDAMPAADRQEMLELGLDQGARLLGLIEDLLLVAAADHDEVRSEQEPVDIGGLVGAIGRELPETVQARLHTSVDETVGTIVSDRDKVRRILLNLVENAGKYAPSGPIELDVRRDGDRVRLAVRDHGPGIAVQDRERVFERFVQLDGSAARRQGGTGLGLHLCRQLSAILGGELVATEALGGGARFVLTLRGALVVDEPRSTAAAGGAPPRGLTRSPLKRPAGLPTSSGEGARPTRPPLAVPLGGGTP